MTLPAIAADCGRLQQIARYRCVSVDDAKTVSAAWVSRLDYCNSILHGTSSSNLDKLQRVQNARARAVMMTKKRDHITPVLARLHWLPVAGRIQFKIALLTFTTYSSRSARRDNSGPPVTTCLKFRGWEPISLNAASPTVLHASGTVYLTSLLPTWKSPQAL